MREQMKKKVNALKAVSGVLVVAMSALLVVARLEEFQWDIVSRGVFATATVVDIICCIALGVGLTIDTFFVEWPDPSVADSDEEGLFTLIGRWIIVLCVIAALVIIFLAMSRIHITVK